MSENKKLIITGVFAAIFLVGLVVAFGRTGRNESKLQMVAEETIEGSGVALSAESETLTEDFDIEVASTNDSIPPVISTTNITTSIKPNKKAKKKFKYTNVPEYSGVPVAELNNDKPFFKKKDKKKFAVGTEYYSPLDELGRCGVAYICVGRETIPAEGESRGEIGAVRPSGWHTVKYPDIIPDLYLYNRCHLIGWQLGAENANECNLITGTRSMNVSAMLQYENMIADYVKRTGNHVMYRVTPYFESDELVARGVLLEAQSIETTDISFCVWCYNVQPGIIIDYKTGDSKVDEHYAVPVDDSNDGQSVAGMSDPSNASATDNNAATATSTGMGEDKDIASETTYVLNTNTHKFHYVDCPSVKQMATHNMEQTTMTRDEIIAAGYSPCGNCKP